MLQNVQTNTEIRKKKRDNPHRKIPDIKTTTFYVSVIRLLMRRYNLSFQSLHELLIIVDMYRTGKTITPYKICKISEGESCRNFRTSLRRIETLLKRDLIEVIGIGKNGGKIIVPSVKALEELSELCK